MSKSSFLLAFACGAFIFSIDEKTKQKNLDKIKALLVAGTRTHVFCPPIALNNEKVGLRAAKVISK